MDNLFSDSVERLLSEISTPMAIRAIENGSDITAMWQSFEESGFLDALVPESQDGAGLTLDQVFPILTSAGRNAVPLPFAHTMLARGWLAAAGVAAPSGPITIAGLGMRLDEGVIEGRTIPFGRVAHWVLADLGDYCALLPVAGATSQEAEVHGSLSATLRWEKWPEGAVKISASSQAASGLSELAAAGYAALMAGVSDRVLELTLDYANQRSQFGKNIGRFQAVQSQISLMAERTWATRMAAQLACQSTACSPSPLLAAVGKARASEAAPIIADIGHAVHGAIGITEEYDLQLYTRRLREWRLAEGAETYWCSRLGSALLAQPEHSALSFICAKLSASSHACAAAH
ncbi:acyl-CoA dehydrogenase [Alcaligenaceae bacterium]|nr:acyl-CoA dehydrogenase [Alcaligenaceae bacterium]